MRAVCGGCPRYWRALHRARLTPCKWLLFTSETNSNPPRCSVGITQDRIATWLDKEWLAHRLQPGREHCQPAGIGEEVVVLHHSHTRGEDPLQKTRIVPPLERHRSLPSTLRDDLLQFRANIAYCIQEPGDVVLFSSLTAHCVLTGPGPAALMTTTLKVEGAEEERVQHLGAQYQPQGVSRAIRQPGSRGRSRGKRRSRFS